MLSLSIALPDLFALMESLNVSEPLSVAAWGVGLVAASLVSRSLSDRFPGAAARRGAEAPETHHAKTVRYTCSSTTAFSSATYVPRT